MIMKKNYIIFNFIIFVFFIFAMIGCGKKENVDSDLIGQWQVVMHNESEVVEFDPYYHHFLVFSEDHTFKMQSAYFHPNQDFDYKRGWFPRISEKQFKLYLTTNLTGTYTFENNTIKLYDQNFEPFSYELVYELKENRIKRVSTTNYAKFIYEKVNYESIKQSMQGEWHIDITSTNKLSDHEVNFSAIMKIKVFNDYISFYGQYSSTSIFSLKFYPGESRFLILNVDSDELITGYIVGNAMHIVFDYGIHLIYIKNPDN
jgi:hypothetical protein